jgi:hypothetical protein
MTKFSIQMDKAAIVGEHIQFDNLKIDVDGTQEALVTMLMGAFKESSDLLSWVSAAIVMHYHRQGVLDEWLRYVKLGVALLDEKLPGFNTEIGKAFGEGPG